MLSGRRKMQKGYFKLKKTYKYQNALQSQPSQGHTDCCVETSTLKELWHSQHDFKVLITKNMNSTTALQPVFSLNFGA